MACRADERKKRGEWGKRAVQQHPSRQRGNEHRLAACARQSALPRKPDPSL